ncbi:hypothetical protein L3Y34_019633 [Caenorhabditis briggsae]|uniref:C3H1-type domain-containing protein n=1 Tax=Caenorhabditis briggsae TaxID=6238 RepID=A0AAE9DQC9_CAEBR|nr:hypothetical protein L3Y34_019633 [Caenorhabditis briggsae]
MPTVSCRFYNASVYGATPAAEDKENASKPRNFKSRICRHYQSGKVCHMGPRCGFAHGEHELTTKFKAEGKRKTRICVSFAPGGDGNCQEGSFCHFLHPSDGPVFAKRRFCTTQEALDKLENGINAMVRQWNKTWPKGPNYFDMHWMTTRGAQDYAAGIIIWMQRTNQKTAYLETGRGNHSTCGFAAIRTLLLAK